MPLYPHLAYHLIWHVIIITYDMPLSSQLVCHRCYICHVIAIMSVMTCLSQACHSLCIRQLIILTSGISLQICEGLHTRYVKVYTPKMLSCHTNHVIIFTSHKPRCSTKPGNHLYIRHVIVCLSGSSSSLRQSFYLLYISHLIIIHWVLGLVKH